MKTLKLTSAWILICLITAVSSGPSERASSHHVVQHGARTPQKTSPDSFGPTGVQIPDHVLSTQDVSCISADNNIFQIMQEAQKTCNGTDMRCTFYHFVNPEYRNIGTLDVNKELFDDLLMKFDNWLLTAESIDKTRENGKTNEHSTNTTSNHEKDKYKNEGRNENLTDTTESNQGKLNDNISESDDDRQHSHHIKNPDETHRKNHHHKLKNLNHVKAFTEYNKEHKYFEVFMPKDRETGKPRTIYVEVDEDKHEFILIDEDIDKKLKGIKPIRIELDELSDIADTAFSNLVKSASHKKHNHNNNTNENQITASDLHTDSGLDKIEIHLDVGKDESAHNIFNSSVCDSPICNISTNQEIILNSDMEHIENTLNDTNLVVPVEYINEEQIQTKSQIDNTTQDIITDHLDILQNINETDIQEPEYEKESFDTVEFDHNNITDFDIDSNYIEVNSSQDFIKIPCENEDDNCTEHHDFSIDHDIDTYDDNNFIQLDERNDTSNDTDFDDTHETLSAETIDLNESVLQDDQPIQETKLETIPYKPKLPSTLNDGVVDYTSSDFHLLPLENQNAPTELQDHSLESHAPMKPFTAIPILGKDSAKAVETESQSSFLEYAPAVLSESDSHNLVLNPDLNPSVLLRDYSSPVANKKVSGNPKTVSPDLSIATKNPSLLPIAPSYNGEVPEPYLNTAPFQLGANIPMSTKNSILPSQFALPKSLGDFDIMPSTDQFNESPLSVTPYSIPQYTPDFLPTKDNLGLVKYLPMDNDIKETMTPCSANRNRYPCNTIPYSSNPCLKPPQYLPSYYEPPVPITPLQPTSKIPSVEFLPNSVDQSNVCFNADYPRETKPIPLLPFAPCTPFSPLNPLWLEPGSFPSTCPNLWNNIPYQTVPYAPYSVLPAQNICNYPSMLSNYLTPNIGPQQDQFLKLFPIKEIPKVSQQLCECPNKNVLQVTPSTNVLYSPMFTRPVQIDFNPTLNLGRDLQTLSFKYGIPLTKIHEALDAEISDNPKSWLPFELPRPKFVNVSPIKNKPATNSVDHDQNRSGNNKDLIESHLINLTPLDSTLIGPRLDIDESLRLSPNDFQTYTVASETTGSQLSTLETSNIHLSDDSRTGNIKLHLKSDSRNLVPLESSLMGPDLKISSPPVNLRFQTLSPIKPLLNNDIKIINEMLPLESDITELTPLDASHVDLVNNVKPLEILQYAKTTTTTVGTEANFVEGELVSESDSHKVIPLDSSLLGPNLKTQNSAIITYASEGKSGSLKPHENIESTDIKVDEMESIILPSSMLTTLLSKPVNADLNLATDSSNSKLNHLLETNLELPTTESSSIKTKETDFQIIEPSLEMIDATILEGKSKPTDITVEVNSKTQLDSSLTGPSLLQGPESREMTQILDSVDHFETYEAVPISNLNKKLLNIIATTDSEIQYDSSLTGPNLQQGMKTTGKDMESIIELDDSFVTPDFLETIESSATSSLSEAHQLHGSIKGTLKPESEYRAFDSKNVLDSSLVGPHLQTTPFSNDEIKMIHKELQQKSELANLIPLDSSLVGPHLHFDSRPDLSDISRYHNPESSSFFKGGSSLKPIDMPSDLQELLSKFTKSHLSPCEMKPSEKSLSSIANICAESSAEIPMKSNIGNTVQPVDVTMISASELSPQYSLDSEIIEEIKPYEHIEEKFLPTGTVSSLPTNLSQQIKFHPVLSKYLTIPQSLHNILPLSKHKHQKTTPPLLGIPEEIEEIDTTDFIPLSELKSEPLVVDYIPADKQATILKNIPQIEPDITQFSSYTTLSNTDFPPSKPNPLLTKLPSYRYGNQLSQNTPIYLSPKEYKDLIQGFLPKESSSSTTFTSTNPKPDLISPMTVGTRPIPLYTSPISFRPEDWVQPPILAKYLPAHEIPVEVAPEKENIQTFLNKYKLNNKMSPTGINNYPYELVSGVPLKMDTVKPIPLRKSGPNTEYDVIELNNFSEYDNEMIPYEVEPKNNEVRDSKPKSNEAMSFTEVKPEIIEGLSMPKYHDITHKNQKPSKLDSFYANNHIGKSPQVFTVPEYNTLPVGPAADVKTLHNVSPDILNDFTEIPTDFEFVPKLESLSHKSSDFQPKIAYAPTKIPENYLYPCLKPCSQREFPPNAIELANISEMPCQTTLYAPNDNIKYSGYKTYQMPYSKPPKMTQNFVTPIQEYVPSVVPCTSPIHSIKPSNVQQITNPCEFHSPAEEVYEPHNPPIDIKTSLQTKLGLDTIQEIPEFEEYDHLIPEHQTLVDKSTPVQKKLGLNTLNESLEFEEYNQEESPVHADNDIEDKELKTSLLNYINKREDVKNNIYNSNAELTIPIGNIAITKKEPHNANTIQTNNPSIGLKIWKSNVKIAQAELKLKFKDLSVTNFMPVVNNLDEYDMDEIRKIIKNYIDDKYGPHIEVNEPYTVDNKYAVIKDFEHHAADNKYNLLWPTKYV
ncbi:hypothetical protein PYW08_012371 [Mythimna loreyi]|uniref:Uncharacterized protein n=1 Tax=Mythimna loreyi TaxID=667449 RepID=A0ACC2Q0K8_9NEOP|nr:hypothetical protein PYW08_012371 [Mythimna loreyi]